MILNLKYTLLFMTQNLSENPAIDFVFAGWRWASNIIGFLVGVDDYVKIYIYVYICTTKESTINLGGNLP